MGEFVDGEVDAGAFVEELGGFLGHRRAAHRPVTPWGRLRSVRTGARPPAEVYDLVSNVPTMASRSDEVADAWCEQRADEAAVRVGDRFTARNQNFGRQGRSSTHRPGRPCVLRKPWSLPRS